MNRCWKCSQELPEGASLCHACGADQQDRCPLPPQCSEEARAMRAIYDHYGCRQVLGNATLLHNALGDYLGEDGRKLRNQVRIAMDSGLGKLYLSQLEHPSEQFSAQAIADTIRELLARPEQRKELAQAASQRWVSQETELHKLYELL